MRRPLACGLLLFSVLTAGAARLMVGVAGAEESIPQDAERMEKKGKEVVAWMRRTTVAEYDKVGKKDPRWDRLAREALDLVSREFGERGTTITSGEVLKAIKAAVDAGCDDPLVRYAYARASVGPDYPGPAEYLRRAESSCKALAARRYPAFRRARAIELACTLSLGNKAPDEAAREAASREFDAALALLGESVATDERNVFWEDRWFDILRNLITGYRTLGMDAVAAYQRVDAGLAKRAELEVLRLQIRGAFWMNYGWEARSLVLQPQKILPVLV